MAEKAIHEMISSFAAGCMDKQNFEQFKEYVNQEGELPPSELGELQNVISLLPIILELEKPEPKLKDKLAKKLISMQDEIKEKIRLTKQSNQSKPEETDQGAVNVDGSVKEDEPVSSPDKLDDDFLERAKYADAPPTLTRTYELPPRSKDDLEKEDKKSLLPVWLTLVAGFIVLVAAIGFVYYSSNSYQERITSLESRVNTLEGQLSTTSEFVNEYQSVIEFINYKDVEIISLTSVGENTASGKLLLSFEHRRGLLGLDNMPALSSNQAFQVWLVSEGKSYSAGLFIPRRNIKYIEVPSLPSVPREQIDLVRVTIEPAEGSDVPEGTVVLVGSIMTGSTNEPESVE